MDPLDPCHLTVLMFTWLLLHVLLGAHLSFAFCMIGSYLATKLMCQEKEEDHCKNIELIELGFTQKKKKNT